jgi:hypothetical protein
VRNTGCVPFFDIPNLNVKKKGRRGHGTIPYAFTQEGVAMISSVLKSERACLRSTGVWGNHRKYLPLAFTEQGAVMLSGVLKGYRAAEVNVAIMRAFVQLRRESRSYEELREELGAVKES